MVKNAFFIFFCVLVAATLPRAWAARRFDVVIVGAGPAGLVSAIEAAQYGASVLVLEKREILEGDVPGEWGSRRRVIGLQVRTFENLKEMVPDISAATVASLEVHSSSGELLAPNVKDFQNAGLVKQVHISLNQIEEALLKKARTLPIEIVFGAQNTRFSLGDKRSLTYEFGNQTHQIDFLVAALAIGSKTEAYESLFGPRVKNDLVNAVPMISADFKVNESVGGFDMLKDSGPNGMVRAVALTANGFSSLSVFEPKEVRHLVGEEFESKAREILFKALKSFRLSGEIVSKPMRFDLGQDRIEHVYRNGVFVIGDAARRTSPTTGLGVNLGIKDATAFGQLVNILKNEPQKFERSLVWLKDIIEMNTRTSAEKSESIQTVLQRESAKYFNEPCEQALGSGDAAPLVKVD